MKRVVFCMSGLVLFLTAIFGILLYEPKEVFDVSAPRFVCIANSGQYYWQTIRQGIMDGDEALGCYTKWVDFPRYDTQEQLRLLKKLDYLHIDGLITLGEPFSEEVSARIREIREKGIPVVLMDTDDPKSGRNVYIGTDNRQAGLLAAKALAEETNQQAECAVILSKESYANQNERLEGFRKGLEAYPDMHCVAVIEAEGDKLSLQEQIAEVFAKYPSLNAVFCAESASTRRLWPILPEEKREGMAIIGFDNAEITLEFIKKGYYVGTIVQNPYAIGYQSVEMLHTLQQKDAPEFIYTSMTYITAENMAVLEDAK